MKGGGIKMPNIDRRAAMPSRKNAIRMRQNAQHASPPHQPPARHR